MPNDLAKRSLEAPQEAMETDVDSLTFEQKHERYEPGEDYSCKERHIGPLSLCALRPPAMADDAPAPICYVATQDIGQ